MPDREYFNSRRKARRQKFIDLLGGKCERCGTTESLHFDHKNPKKKEFRIADKIDAPEELLSNEVNKCVLMCAPCHRDKTREKGEHGQPKAQHGTLWMYKKYKCRCNKCKRHMSEYNKGRRMLQLAHLIERFVKLADESSEDKKEGWVVFVIIKPNINMPPGREKLLEVLEAIRAIWGGGGYIVDLLEEECPGLPEACGNITLMSNEVSHEQAVKFADQANAELRRRKAPAKVEIVEYDRDIG